MICFFFVLFLCVPCGSARDEDKGCLTQSCGVEEKREREGEE